MEAPDAVEIRVVGCLVEKQRTTPDAYPLSLNALRLACNQATNRDPVVDYDEATVREALRKLALRGWTRLASGAGSRAQKYRQLIEEELGLAPDEVALLAVLMLRGTQTPGELNQRGARLHGFADLAAVYDALERLTERGHVVRLERRPGQKEERYMQVLGGEEEEQPGAGESQAEGVGEGRVAPTALPATATAPGGSMDPAERAVDPAERAMGQGERDLGSEGAPAAAGGAPEGSGERLDRLEREVAELRERLAELRSALGD